MGQYAKHYAELFRRVEEQYGRLDGDTLTAVLGFSVGGPVSLSTIKAAGLFVTCELSVYEEQVPSSEGLKFELMSVGDFDQNEGWSLLTAVGALSMSSQLGHGHSIDASLLNIADVSSVRLSLYSTADIDGSPFGVYQVHRR